MFIGDWLGKRADLTPEKIAIVDTVTGTAADKSVAAESVSYAAWNRQANRTANWLAQLGVAKGDRVAVLAMNCMAYLDIWFACGKLGAILQNLNWRLAAPELARLLADAEPSALIYGPEFAETVPQLVSSLPRGCRLIGLDSLNLSENHLPFSQRETMPADPPPVVDLDWDDPWVICYTGGTTGLPKGAILSHGNITWNAVNTVTGWGLRPDDVAVLNAPLFHTGGLNVFTAPLVHLGGTSILCRTFDVDQLFDLIENRGVTLFFGVPTMFGLMQQHPRWPEVDFSGCRIVISGGAPCPQPIFERFWAKGVDFKTGYGLTEAGPNTFWLPPEDVRRKPGAVGFPLMHIDVRIVDEDGAECGPGAVGELLIRGPHVTPGYWRNPEATAQAIVDGWLHTGDLAQRDEDGYLTVVGRIKEMFISGGENVFPAEVESVMTGHPQVVEAALVPQADPVWGEVGHAFVVQKPSVQPDVAQLDLDQSETGQSKIDQPEAAPLTESNFIAYLQSRLARYKLPKKVTWLDDLPKTGVGKIDKKALEDLANQPQPSPE